MSIINELKSTVNHEIQTILQVCNHIDKKYEKAVNAIYKCKGKVIMTGVGKSGIIAQKISSTFVSTGTLSVFLHPTEGMHGDMGVVQRNDIVFAISKSGESCDLNSILMALSKIGAKIISLTSNRKSTLALKSDISLYMDVTQESCPYNLAPTDSTTAALVIGDAIAIALMKMRKFTKSNFAMFHPGGLLGRRLLLTVGDVMRIGERNPVISVSDSVKNMLYVMTKKMAGAVSVVGKKGILLGLVTDYDIRKTIENGEALFDKRIADIMNKNPESIVPAIKAYDALRCMELRKKPISVMPVINKNNTVVGMLHIHDILSKGL